MALIDPNLLIRISYLKLAQWVTSRAINPGLAVSTDKNATSSDRHTTSSDRQTTRSDILATSDDTFVTRARI